MPRPNGKPITPTATRQLVVIEEVDIATLRCSVRDKQGASHGAVFRNSGPLQEIPNTGQLWVAERMNTMEWHLQDRREDAEELANRMGMSPGETILRAGELLKIIGTEIDIILDGDFDALVQVPGTTRLEMGALESRAFGSTVTPAPMGAMRMQRQVTGGSTNSWILANIPVDVQTVQLFNNGVLVDPIGLGLTTDVLTFPSIAVGHTLVVYYQTLVS